MIPKIMNFYWSGSKMSWFRWMTLFSFRKLNPDWEINLYHDNFTDVKQKSWKEEHNRQDFFDYTGEDYRDRCPLKEIGVNSIAWVPEDTFGLDMNKVCPSQRSNFFKWDMLGRGCFYGDMDIVFTKPMDDMYDIVKDYDAGICFDKYYSIGFMFGSDGNELFKEIYKNACDKFAPITYQGAGVDTLYRRWTTLGDMVKEFRTTKVFNIPKEWFYHFDHLHIPMMFEENNPIPDDIYGLHWYAGCAMSQNFNNIANSNNIKLFNNTISNVLWRVM